MMAAAAAAAETAAAACSHMQRTHSCMSKAVAAPEAARAGNFSKRNAQSRMTEESPSELDRYLQADDEPSSISARTAATATAAETHALAFVLCLRKWQEAAQHHGAAESPRAEARAALSLSRRRRQGQMMTGGRREAHLRRRKQQQQPNTISATVYQSSIAHELLHTPTTSRRLRF
jgi:hypothetical protein